MLRVLDIVEGTIVDGPGLRTSIYLSGCTHHCVGCHNPQSWQYENGKPMTVSEILAIIEENGFNVSLSGGDPFFQIDNLIPLLQQIKKLGISIWCYTGYTYEQIINNEKLSQALPYIDVLVDGRFDTSKRDIDLRFRGSSNQRLIDVQNSSSGKIRFWEE